ncbi:MAG: amidohydrolase family protein [Lacrimispora sp.]
MVIDANMYWFSEEIFGNDKDMSKFLSEIPCTYGTKGYLKEDGSVRQIVIEKPPGCQNLNYAQGDYILEKQLQDMEAAGVDKAVLKLPGCHEWMSLDTCRKFNDQMAAHGRKSQGKCIPLGVVPPIAGRECFDEVDRCRMELGINHIQLCAHYGNLYLDHEVFSGFFQKLNERKTTVYIHHTPVPVEYGSLYDYNNLRRSYGRCVDQATAVGRELFSGFFEKYPNLTFVHSMLGGGFFAIANMLFPHQAKAEDQIQMYEVDKGDIRNIFKEHIYFEMSHAQPWGKEQLECAVRVLGADHVIFGTSYPVRREWLMDGPEFVRGLNLTEEEKELILWKNATRLYGIA